MAIFFCCPIDRIFPGCHWSSLAGRYFSWLYDRVGSHLSYIDKIENVSINENFENYKKYFDLSKNEIANDLYNTYNSYLENKYEININYQALDKTKNYF